MHKHWRRVLAVAALCGGVVAAALSTRWTVADHYVVPTSSMSPSIHVSDRVLVNKAAYDLRVPFTTWSFAHFEGPKRGDVVVLASPVDGRVLVKRVVGLPGDIVTVTEGRVSINGAEMPVVMTAGGLVEQLACQIGRIKDGLRAAFAVADVYEDDAAQIAPGMDPAAEGDGLPDVFGA